MPHHHGTQNSISDRSTAAQQVRVADIARRIRAFALRRGAEYVEPAPVVNDFYPKSFNHSLEAVLVRRYGSIFDFDSPWSFSCVQPCIRIADFARWRKSPDPTHLGAFFITPVDFTMSPNPADLEELWVSSEEALFAFLIAEIGLDPTRMEVLCFAGALEAATRARVESCYDFPPDSVTPTIARAHGVRRDAIIQVSVPDTFVARGADMPEFWAGYRYEVFYEVRPGLRVEVATGEAVRWKSEWAAPDEVRIVPLPGAVVAAVVGLERLAMAASLLDSVYEVDVLQSVCDALGDLSSRPPADPAVRHLADGLRALTLVLADMDGWETLPNAHLRRDFRKLLRDTAEMMDTLGLRLEDLPTVCAQVGIILQDWVPRSARAADRIPAEIRAYCRRKGRPEPGRAAGGPAP